MKVAATRLLRFDRLCYFRDKSRQSLCKKPLPVLCCNTGLALGVSFNILNSIRIEKAKALLMDPSLKIGEIAELVGYADTAHFARTFKKLEGMSANEYRNILR